MVEHWRGRCVGVCSCRHAAAACKPRVGIILCDKMAGRKDKIWRERKIWREQKIFGGNSKDMAGTNRVVGGRLHSIRIAHHHHFSKVSHCSKEISFLVQYYN